MLENKDLTRVDEWIDIKFEGFTPDAATETWLRKKCRDLLDMAPANASVLAEVALIDNEASLVLSVNSLAGKFTSHATGKTVGAAAHAAISQLHKKILHWKTIRFLPTQPPTTQISGAGA